jgi:hypothetical protein
MAPPPTRSTLELMRWDTSTLVDCFNIAVFGARNTGKSCLLRDIIYRLHTKGYPRIVVFSGTEEANAGYKGIIPPRYVHNGLDLDAFRSLYETQKRVVSTWREAKERCPDEVRDVDPRLVIVLDDLMYRRHLTKSEIFGEIACNGRHYMITMILSVQYLMSLDIVVRSNLDYVVVLRESIPRNLQRLYESFFAIFRKRDDFYAVLAACTNDYECLVLDKTRPTNDVASVVHWYRAQVPLPPFVFGSRESRAWAAGGGGSGAR